MKRCVALILLLLLCLCGCNNPKSDNYIDAFNKTDAKQFTITELANDRINAHYVHLDFSGGAYTLFRPEKQFYMGADISFFFPDGEFDIVETGESVRLSQTRYGPNNEIETQDFYTAEIFLPVDDTLDDFFLFAKYEETYLLMERNRCELALFSYVLDKYGAEVEESPSKWGDSPIVLVKPKVGRTVYFEVEYDKKVYRSFDGGGESVTEMSQTEDWENLSPEMNAHATYTLFTDVPPTGQNNRTAPAPAKLYTSSSDPLDKWVFLYMDCCYIVMTA